MAKTLILCSPMPEAQRYYREAKKRGEETVAASSVPCDETACFYDRWEFLPDIYDAQFLQMLKKTIERHDVRRIFCPHDLVYLQLRKWQEAGDLAVPLIGEMVAQQRMSETRTLLEEASRMQRWAADITQSEPPPLFRMAALLRQTDMTYGESSASKLAAMAGLFPTLPEGDVVEIGSLWGKTACALAMLARDYATGAVLCVDPWAYENARQHDSADMLRDLADINDLELLFTGFTIHAAAVATPGRFNYLRMASVDAHAVYKDKRQVSSFEFGKTDYAGKLALIHIDGNHDYACVKADYEAWRPHMLPGGWVILDDYVWAHGDGPKRAGDEAIRREAGAVRRSFVVGKALFLQY